MSDIFREVDEALQQEKMLNLWNEYKNTIIAAIIILLLSVSATTLYKNWDASRNAAETQKLMQALESPEPAKALAEFAKDTRKNHKALAQFDMASLALEEGNTEEAARLYGYAAESSKTPRAFRDLARILHVQNSQAPSLDILKPLLSDEKSPWIWHARLEAAVIAANNKNYDQALSYLKPFESVEIIPLSLKQRGLALQHVYSIEKSQNITPTEKESK